VWFVTGAGRGFGRLFAEVALAGGDRVVGTARRPEALDDLSVEHEGRLVVLRLDVTNRAAVFAAVERAFGAFGRLDVVINNAGYGLSGAVEEVTEGRHVRSWTRTSSALCGCARPWRRTCASRDLATSCRCRA